MIAHLRDKLKTAQQDLRAEERAAFRAQSALEDAEADLESAEEELESIHSGVGLRSIIERAYAADPSATENDLLSAELHGVVSTLKIDHQYGRLPLFPEEAQ